MLEELWDQLYHTMGGKGACVYNLQGVSPSFSILHTTKHSKTEAGKALV